ncbi:AraC family transcriptional regulator [Burkholderia plantarii]|uniref:Putative transcriptional regulator, AraC family n=1 Tax=Burkholderia plantarii TaxID=41899 RepID=A0A0B6S8V0_BURPL|nr:AraC family transcriptional regulator [Burkholderia plantarii]AJK50834.1 putative transcriptional regulator, AraC family [Burkholderia plantarii]
MLSALKTACARVIEAGGGHDGLHFTPLDGLVLVKASGKALPSRMIYRPALCVVVQGEKQVTLGERTFRYAEQHALVVSLELPLLGGVTRASRSAPYLGFILEFDLRIMRHVIDTLRLPVPRGGEASLGLFVDEMDDALIGCLTRLIEALPVPHAAQLLYPGIMTEICFRLLTGRNAESVGRFALPHGHTQRIADAIAALRTNFSSPVRIEQLASVAGMSASSFHQHFKALTSMTPLQYQKQLRLLEARNLMTAEALNVTDAALQVGYESTSQFSREYKRMFGTTPKRDALEARQPAAVR